MARVDDQVAPGVAPSVAAPDQSIRVNASPDAFGGAGAQALGQAGQALTKTGEFFGQVQTDDAVNTAMDGVNDRLDKYRSLNGREALDGREGVEKDIDEIFRQGRQNLKRADQQLAYDNQTRSYRARYVNGIIASHSDSAAKAYTKETNEGAFKVALGNIANVADDDDHVEAFVRDARRAQVRQVVAEGNGADLAAVNSAIRNSDRYAYKTQIETVAVKNPVRALELTEKHKDILGLDYASISSQLRTRVNEQNGLGVAEEAVGAAANHVENLPPAQATAPAVRQAIFEIESGNRSNAPTSVDGAVGPGQVLPETFQRFAKPGEKIENPDDNRAVSARYIEHLSALPNVQGDPARIAVGYFSGEGNIAPVGAPQPFIADRRDGNGKSTSSYVADVTGRMSQKGAMLAAKGNAYDYVLTKTAGNPAVRQVALREIDNRYRAAQVASMASDQALQSQQNAALRRYGDIIRDGKGAAMPWRQDQNLTEQQVEHLDELAAKAPAVGNGPGYAQAHQDVLGGKIVNVEQLLPMTRSGALTATGYSDLAKSIEEFKKPGAEADKLLQSNFYNSVRKAITLTMGDDSFYEKTVTPERQKAWDKALPVINQALADGRAKGLTNAQMMDPESKDSIWPSLKPLMPTPAEALKAEIDHDAERAKAAAAKPDPDAWQKIGTVDDALAAYNDHKITKEQARILWDRNGWGAPSQGAPVVPTEDKVEAPDVHDLMAPAGSEFTDETKWQKRADGSDKGHGFLGLLRRPDGGVSSEISIGVNLGGKEVEIPTLVPTLSRAEVEAMLNLKKGGDVPRSVVDKAVAFAKKRLAAGKSPFAGPDESPK